MTGVAFAGVTGIGPSFRRVFVIPAQAGIQKADALDTGLRRYDESWLDTGLRRYDGT